MNALVTFPFIGKGRQKEKRVQRTEEVREVNQTERERERES